MDCSERNDWWHLDRLNRLWSRVKTFWSADFHAQKLSGRRAQIVFGTYMHQKCLNRFHSIRLRVFSWDGHIHVSPHICSVTTVLVRFDSASPEQAQIVSSYMCAVTNYPTTTTRMYTQFLLYLDSIAVSLSLFGWSKQIQFKSSPNRVSEGKIQIPILILRWGPCLLSRGEF